MACPICRQRKAKRACPAKGEAICSICCGREREVTVDCPFECSYLVDARARDRLPDAGPQPYPDVKLSVSFIQRNSGMFGLLATAFVTAAREEPALIDRDVRDALDAAIAAQRALDSGIYYEMQPQSPYARNLAAAIERAAEVLQNPSENGLGLVRRQDFDLLETLVVLRRIAHDEDNGRPRGRSFLHMLALQFGRNKETQEDSRVGLILPGR